MIFLEFFLVLKKIQIKCLKTHRFLYMVQIGSKKYRRMFKISTFHILLIIKTG
jgi:hypothetical protein